MKKFTKYFGALLALVAIVTINAETAIFNPTVTTAVSVKQVSLGLQQVSIANAATSAVTVTFYDAPTNVLTYVVGAYTNNVLTLANVVTDYTNYVGVVEHSTNYTLTSTLTPVSATTNNYRTILVQTVPASSTIVFTPPQRIPVGFGLAAVASATNVIATLTYLPTR